MGTGTRGIGARVRCWAGRVWKDRPGDEVPAQIWPAVKDGSGAGSERGLGSLVGIRGETVSKAWLWLESGEVSVEAGECLRGFAEGGRR
jgi:hypothetical protein